MNDDDDDENYVLVLFIAIYYFHNFASSTYYSRSLNCKDYACGCNVLLFSLPLHLKVQLPSSEFWEISSKSCLSNTDNLFSVYKYTIVQE